MKKVIVKLVLTILVFVITILVQAIVVRAEPATRNYISVADYSSPIASSDTVISCPANGDGGDDLRRGFYIENYPGSNLGTVQLNYIGDPGTYIVSLTARSGTYDGPVIGTTKMATVNLSGSNATATFDFDASVTPGTTVTFLQSLIDGPSFRFFYDVGPCTFDLFCTACPNVYQTNGQTPPLDTFRRRSVGVTITAFTKSAVVDADIKPGSEPNSINLESKGIIPVAILTTNEFDATTVDPLSVELGPSGATESHGKGHIEDVDGDADLDLLLHFRTQETGIQCGDTTAALTGETFDGQAFEGSDSIWTVNCD